MHFQFLILILAKLLIQISKFRTKFNPLNVVTNPISSSEPTLSCKVNEQGLIVETNAYFNITISIIDSLTSLSVKNISWKNFKWSASLSLLSLDKCGSSGTLNSLYSTVTFSTSTGLASFNDLSITSRGMYLLLVNVKTVGTNDYNFNCVSTPIQTKESNEVVGLDESLDPNVILTFTGNFSEQKSKLNHFQSMIFNCLLVKYNLKMTRFISLYEGSIKINFGKFCTFIILVYSNLKTFFVWFIA